MSQLDENSERGLAVIEEMLGSKFSGAMRKAADADDFAADLARIAVAWSYGACWAREGLARREKSVAVIAALIAMGQPAELRNHVRLGLANGLSVRDLEDLLVQLSSYVGLPRVSTARSAIIDALREFGRDPDAERAARA